MNSYCPGAWSQVISQGYMNWSKATYQTHKFSDPGHGGRYQQFLRALYGPNGQPISLNEWGYGAHMIGGNTDVTNSVKMAQLHMDDFVANNVFAMNK